MVRSPQSMTQCGRPRQGALRRPAQPRLPASGDGAFRVNERTVIIDHLFYGVRDLESLFLEDGDWALDADRDGGHHCGFRFLQHAMGHNLHRLCR